MKALVYRSTRGVLPWRWRIIARNGEIIAQGEGHDTRAKAERALFRTVTLLVQGDGPRLLAGAVLFSVSPRSPKPMHYVWRWSLVSSLL
jgi:uncharacterized protein YegP (UPF0339 family)